MAREGYEELAARGSVCADCGGITLEYRGERMPCGNCGSSNFEAQHVAERVFRFRTQRGHLPSVAAHAARHKLGKYAE